MCKFKKAVSILLCALLLSLSLCMPTFAAEEKFLLLLGDSIAYGSGLKNPTEACYGKILADTCGFSYANHSVPGSTTDAMLNIMKKNDVVEDIKKADIISVSIGGNDFLMTNIVGLMFNAIVRNDYSDFDEIGVKNYENLCKIITELQALNGDADIVLQTLYNPQYGHLRDAYQVGADKINENVKRCAAEYGLKVADVAPALGDDRANFAVDGVHPSVQGNELIAGEILKALNEMGYTDKTELVITEKGEDVGGFFILSGKLTEFMGNFFYMLSKLFGAF